jgi:hypothetical protein
MPSLVSPRRLPLVAALAGAAACADAASDAAGPASPSLAPTEERFRAALSPRETVPAVSSDASGEATLTITGSRRITVRLDVANLAGATDAQAHAGGPGEVGPRLAEVFRTLPGFNPLVNGPLVVYSMDRDRMPDPEAFDAFARHARAGTAYVNVRTLRYPAGEIRGQFVRVTSQ